MPPLPDPELPDVPDEFDAPELPEDPELPDPPPLDAGGQPTVRKHALLAWSPSPMGPFTAHNRAWSVKFKPIADGIA